MASRAGQSPADAKECWSHNDTCIQFFSLGKMELCCKQRRALAKGQSIADKCHYHGTSHDEGEAGVERTSDIEKVLQLRGIDHAADHKAKPKDEPSDQTKSGTKHRAQSPITWRTTNAVAKPIAMKMAVATTLGLSTSPSALLLQNHYQLVAEFWASVGALASVWREREKP
jgi:hypothetical protein